MFEEDTNELTDWNNPPTIADLKDDLSNCKSSHDRQVAIINKYMDNLRADPKPKRKEYVGSSIQPRLIRKHAEWRYSGLSEPFLSNTNIFKVNPTTYEDAYSARQNELVINYQFNTQIDKIRLIDSYVRSAVDTGTAILRVGWEELEQIQDIPEPQYQPQQIDPSLGEAISRFKRVANLMENTIEVSNVPPQWKECIKLAQEQTKSREQEIMAQAEQRLQAMQQQIPPEQLEQYQQQMMQEVQQQIQQLPPIAYEPVEIGTQFTQVVKLINRPTIQICDYRDVYFDPSCEGDIDKAEYIIYKFNSCKADLLADKRYKNIDKIPETTDKDYDDYFDESDNLKDKARKKITVYEYWGNWDIEGNGTKKPIVATWVGDVLIRLEDNPYPDHKPPFVVISYLPIANQLYGEPDGALIADNQEIIGAITRGVIDLLAKSANSQTGSAINFLDPVNKKKFIEGRDYEFNANASPAQAIYQHTFPEIPQTVIPFLGQLEFEAEALTGVKGFSQGINGDSLGESATGARGVLDATSKREMGILRRLADGLKKVARKVIAMNALWLNDSEVIRITNQDFVEVRRDDLAGEFDLTLDISSAEQDTARAESLAFMLQTLGNTVDQGMTQMVLSEICRLKKMPELAERVNRWKPPEPDPMQVRLQEAQVQLIEAQVEKYKAEVQKLSADAGLSEAKAQGELVDAQLKPQEIMSKIQSELSKSAYTGSLSRKLDNDLSNDITGINHKRDLEKQSAQAKAQANKSFQEKYMDYLIKSGKNESNL